MDNDLERLVENAVRWANGKLGSDAYPFKCLAFVEDCYETSNNIEMFGEDCARGSADLYEAHKYEGEPPLGAFVFYSCQGDFHGEAKDWGHVGIHVGGGQVIHSWRVVRKDHYTDIPKLTPAGSFDSPRYIGWVPAERFLQGYRDRGASL